MSSNLAKVKGTNDNTKYDLIFGYIRESEQELLNKHNNDPFYMIPELVIMTCLLYHCFPQIFEQYSNKLHLSQ